MKCAICKKPLSNPESIKRGIGPICWNKSIANAIRKENEEGQAPILDIPFEGDVVCKRTEKGACVNIPQLEIRHSPTGFEWGYGGSGPADLALNVLMLFTDRTNAYQLHQQFKWEFISILPREGGVIKGDEIRGWLKAHEEQGVLF